MGRLLDLAEHSWPLLRRAMHAHTVLYRATGGVIGHTAPGLPTMLLLEHKGARSGKVRTSPLLYFRDGDDLVLIASKGGHPKHPAWFHNLLAHPDVVFGGIPMRAAVVGDSSREPLRGRRISNKEGAVSL